MGLLYFMLWLLIGAMAGAFIGIKMFHLDPYDQDYDNIKFLIILMCIGAVACPLAIMVIIFYVPLKWFVDFLLKRKPSK